MTAALVDPCHHQVLDSVVSRVLRPFELEDVAGDFMDIGPVLGGGARVLAEYARERITRKRIWAAELPLSPSEDLRDSEEQNYPVQFSERENRMREFLGSIEDLSNVRLLAEGFDPLGGLPSRLCCAFVRADQRIEAISDVLSALWGRITPGGALVIHGEPATPGVLPDLLDKFGDDQPESIGQSDFSPMVWVIKAGGRRLRSRPIEARAEREQPRVVVASYGEDLGWTDEIWFPKVVYDATGRSSFEGVVTVQNRAREAGQYLHHIVSHYPDFHSWEIFLQGRPFDHLGEPLPEILGRYSEWPDFHPFGWLVPFDEEGWIHDRWAGDFARDWFGDVPDDLHWVPGAQFAVSREALLSKPLTYWLALQKKVLEEEERSPWAIERCWQAIFLQGAPFGANPAFKSELTKQ